MLLKKLIKNLPKEKKKINIKGLAVDSRKVKKGFIFFAVKGNKLNGEKYIKKAIQNGAVVVVCSKNSTNPPASLTLIIPAAISQ